MKPQSAPITTAAMKPLRKNSYSNGTNMDIKFKIVQKVQAVQTVNKTKTAKRFNSAFCSRRFERLERLERLERYVSYVCGACGRSPIITMPSWWNTTSSPL